MTVTEKDKNSTNSSKTYTSALKSLLAGAGAGLICTIICAPLDVVKVRLQVQSQLGIKKYKGNTISILYKIFQEEGTRGLFKGVGPALLTVPIFWGSYWPIYNRMNAYFAEQTQINQHLSHLLSAITAGAIGDIITNPFWVTRTRFQTLSLHKEIKISDNIGTFAMMKLIYKEEGFMAFYKGLGASFLGLSHVAIQFPLYEYLKVLVHEKLEEPNQMLEILVASTISKVIASSISYPHEVLRARLQDVRVNHNNGSNGQNNGLFRLLVHIITKEGYPALWSGIRVNLIRVIPATTSTFVSYEYISKYLNSQQW